jgi:hypothetical protein
MSEGVIDRKQAEKERGLLEQDYATPCPICGGVVFEWWDSDTCRECEESTGEESTEQAKLITDGGLVQDGTHLDEDGLWIPPEFRDYTGQIVFRTPRATIQHFGSSSLDPYYGMIDKSHFGDPEQMRDPRNPELAPNSVKIKPQGEDAVVLDVEMGVGLLPDGGTVEDDTEQRDPTEDPAACSKCGVHIGAFGSDYCDGCAREIGEKPPLERCMHCGQRAPRNHMESVDISTEDEYYPEIRYFCPDCSGGDSA